ncbi:hypothetical protein F511_18632 [Dorcoceras hygrometricum]|uniref:Uncharacterized protein n=1 Tax=Dorcoceras hygrometricum TaxID=472368 RepID=A0A2Z7DFT7_9LAMI|nr:hypothetical protein F511_18632 [Dorcoceras hygrometricum]
MKQKRNWLMGFDIGGLKPLEIKVNLMGSVVEVILITGFNCQFLFWETIQVLQEEDADIANACLCSKKIQYPTQNRLNRFSR